MVKRDNVNFILLLTLSEELQDSLFLACQAGPGCHSLFQVFSNLDESVFLSFGI